MPRLAISAACLVLLILAVGLASAPLYYAAAGLFLAGLFVPRTGRPRSRWR